MWRRGRRRENPELRVKSLKGIGRRFLWRDAHVQTIGGGWLFWLVHLVTERAEKVISVDGTGGRGFSVSISYIIRARIDGFLY